MLFSLLVFALPLSVSAYCYTRNGTRIANEAYQPCNTTTGTSSHDSACCGTNHSGAGETNVADDVCESNGLCQNFEAFDGNNEGAQLWWRQGCTDPTWQSPYCLKDVCNGTKYAVDNAPVRNCGDNNWCCGDKSCCSKSASIFQLAATVGLSPSSSSSSQTPSPTPSTTPPTSIPPSSSTTAAPPTSSSSTTTTTGLSTAAKAGIGIGAAVVVLLLLTVAFLLLRLNKHKKAKHVALAGHEADSSRNPYTDAVAPMGVHEQKYGVVDIYAHEATGVPQELPGGNGPVELSERRDVGVELEGGDGGDGRVGELSARESVRGRG